MFYNVEISIRSIQSLTSVKCITVRSKLHAKKCGIFSTLCCQVTDKTDPYYIDGEDVKQSNWLRYVNCARTKQEQNCEAFQYRGNIYYKTLREITIGECGNAVG